MKLKHRRDAFSFVNAIFAYNSISFRFVLFARAFFALCLCRRRRWFFDQKWTKKKNRRQPKISISYYVRENTIETKNQNKETKIVVLVYGFAPEDRYSHNISYSLRFIVLFIAQAPKQKKNNKRTNARQMRDRESKWTFIAKRLCTFQANREKVVIRCRDFFLFTPPQNKTHEKKDSRKYIRKNRNSRKWCIAITKDENEAMRMDTILSIYRLYIQKCKNKAHSFTYTQYGQRRTKKRTREREIKAIKFYDVLLLRC